MVFSLTVDFVEFDLLLFGKSFPAFFVESVPLEVTTSTGRVAGVVVRENRLLFEGTSSLAEVMASSKAYQAYRWPLKEEIASPAILITPKKRRHLLEYRGMVVGISSL